MITLNYSVAIKSTPEVVWEKLWNDETYRKWTSVFMEGSYAESTWEEGARIAFLGPDKNGMFGIIKKKVVNAEMTFKHLGEIKNGIEEPKNWENATESYRLSRTEDGTLLTVLVTMDEANKEFENYFNEAFPKGLSILKQICEN